MSEPKYPLTVTVPLDPYIDLWDDQVPDILFDTLCDQLNVTTDDSITEHIDDLVSKVNYEKYFNMHIPTFCAEAALLFQNFEDVKDLSDELNDLSSNAVETIAKMIIKDPLFQTLFTTDPEEYREQYEVEMMREKLNKLGYDIVKQGV